MPKGVYFRTEIIRTGISKARLGKKLSEETKNKIRETLKRKGIKPPQWAIDKSIKLKKGVPRSAEVKEKIRIKHLGRRLSEERKEWLRQYFMAHPTNYWLGKKRYFKNPIERANKISKGLQGKKPKNFGISFGGSGELNYNWKGGITDNPYPSIFNEKLKLKIRTRDSFICSLCEKTEREELEELNRVLCVNHIDFNKDNCNENNLNTLCVRCNIKINKNRAYWTDFFQEKQAPLACG